MLRRILPCETCILDRRAEPHTGFETVLKKLGLVEVCGGEKIAGAMGFAPDSEVWVNEATIYFPEGSMIGFIACRKNVSRTLYDPTVFGAPAKEPIN